MVAIAQAARVSETVRVDSQERVLVVTIDRPQVRNAVDSATAALLRDAFTAFDSDTAHDVAVLTGTGSDFCAGFDLSAVAADGENAPDVSSAELGPMGPTRMLLAKPVIAAVEGHAVAGGLELALWCDLRVAAETAVFGVYCRRFGVPLMDGGTVRLARQIGHSRALDMVLTGRGVQVEEAVAIGLANRRVPRGQALAAAVELATELGRLPQGCMRSDRFSTYEQWAMPLDEALRNEHRRGLAVIASGETEAGAGRFARGEGRHGQPIG